MSKEAKNPWREVLKDLRQPVQRVPQESKDWQYYMKTHKKDINDIYKKRVTTAAKSGLALRSIIAKDVVAEMTPEQYEELMVAVKADYQRKMDRFNSAARREPSKDPADQKE